MDRITTTPTIRAVSNIPITITQTVRNQLNLTTVKEIIFRVTLHQRLIQAGNLSGLPVSTRRR
jgi:hypothetical protein